MVGMATVTTMPAVEHVQERAEEQKEKGPISQQMRAMLSDKKEASNREKANKDKSASRSEKATF